MLNTRKVLNKDLNQLKNDFLKDLNNFYKNFERTLNINSVTTGFNNYKNLKELILHAIYFDNKTYDILNFIKTSIDPSEKKIEFLFTSLTKEQYYKTVNEYSKKEILYNSFLHLLIKLMEHQKKNIEFNILIDLFKDDTIKSFQLLGKKNLDLNELNKNFLLDKLNFKKDFYMDEKTSLYNILVFINKTELIDYLIDRKIPLIDYQQNKTLTDNLEIVNKCTEIMLNDIDYVDNDVELFKIKFEKKYLSDKLKDIENIKNKIIKL